AAPECQGRHAGRRRTAQYVPAPVPRRGYAAPDTGRQPAAAVSLRRLTNLHDIARHGMDQSLIKIPDAAVAPSSLRALPGCGQGELRVFHAADHVETYAWLASPADVPALQAALRASWRGAQT